MATYPDYTVFDLSDFTGRPVESYTNTAYVDMSLLQAEILFKFATCLDENSWPTEPDKAQLAEFAVLSIADEIYLGQQYAELAAAPFQSETIGSYSYSMPRQTSRTTVRVTEAVRAGLPTGISWFDLAVGQLGVCAVLNVTHTSTRVFEDDWPMVEIDGERVVLAPHDLNWYPIPAFYRGEDPK